MKRITTRLLIGCLGPLFAASACCAQTNAATEIDSLNGLLGEATGFSALNQRHFTLGRATQSQILQGYGKLPLRFEVNCGQTDSRVKFLSRAPGYTLFLTPNEALFALRVSQIQGRSESPIWRRSGTDEQLAMVLRIKLAGSNPHARLTGLDELSGKSNYFIGTDPIKWHTSVSAYARVRAESVYPGIDLVYYGRQRELEQDFIVAPGAHPEAIVLGVEGAESTSITDDGELVLTTPHGELRLRKPVVYQETAGVRHEIPGGYRFVAKNRIGFRVGLYDPSRPLVIDPVLGYSSYLGGSGSDAGYGIAVDSLGNVYVTGITSSIDFPGASSSPIQSSRKGYNNAFVAKINAAGSALVYSAYLGGSGSGSLGGSEGDAGYGIAVDSSGNAYVTGATTSKDFPGANASKIQPSFSGLTDAFVVKINASGNALVYSTYLGGSSGVGHVGERAFGGSGIAVDRLGDAYVTGFTNSTDFPGASSSTIQSFLRGGGDAFVAKINAAGSALVYSTYLGGSDGARGIGIAVDSRGSAYVTGSTTSTDFPGASSSPIQSSLKGYADAFVAKINVSGSALVYSTYLGGSSGDDEGFGIAVDSLGNAYVTGIVDYSTDFPVTKNALQPFLRGFKDAFVAKINVAGSALVYSTYLGGSGDDVGFGIAVDSFGNAYVTGYTGAADFPGASSSTVQSSLRGITNAFVAKINAAGSALVYSTYLGGSGGFDIGNGIALDSLGNAYVTGLTESTDFPGAGSSTIQNAMKGFANAFVAKLVTPIPYKAFVQPPINADGNSVFNSRRGVIPVKFTLTLNDTPTCSLPPATIAVTRTAGGALGLVDENVYMANPDGGANFRVHQNACHYSYSLAASSLGVGTYRIDISIEGIAVGHAVFALEPRLKEGSGHGNDSGGVLAARGHAHSVYSYRTATIGSTHIARRAGI